MDPAAIVSSLSEPQIRQRLDEIDGERRALMILLRAAMARQRKRRKQPAPSHKEGGRK